VSEIAFRRATRADLQRIVELLADDRLGATRELAEDPVPRCYVTAFAALESDPNQQLIVCEQDGLVVGCLQLSFIPGLSRRGAWRAQIESVRVASASRGAGLGERLMAFAIDAARTRGCSIVQLTTDKARPEARRFYERLGLAATHEGMKLSLRSPT
jgi:ribosomal protein S18 acetylase RimI-like enzyme